MRNPIINNTPIEHQLSFYNYKNNSIQSNIWSELKSGLLNDFLLESYLHNNLLPSESFSQNKPIFDGFYQLPSGLYWDGINNCVKEQLYYPKRTDGSLNHLIEVTAKYIDTLNAGRMGVHLSGGFDSSLIMCLLSELNIPFVPIGLKSDTFEFRTERVIQDIMISRGEDGLLIDMEDFPHYSNLDQIPAHQIPDSDIKTVSAANAVAEAFKQRNCDIVFTGLGGDSLFVDEIKSLDNLSFNIGNEFVNPTEADRVYAPRNIKLESFFAQHDIIDVICSAREGQSIDFLKLWARNWTKSLIPAELSNWSYCADFFGLSMWGLEKAKPTIKFLMEEAYDISHHQLFNPTNIKKFINQDVFSFEYTDYIQFCGLISVASWYHSLYNNG